MIRVKIFCCNPFQENSYLLYDESGEGIAVDPGFYDGEELSAFCRTVEENNISLRGIWLTHGHFDHVYGVQPLIDKVGALPVYMHPGDRELLSLAPKMVAIFRMKEPQTAFSTLDLADGDILEAGASRFRVITTPGHTRGGVCFYSETDKILLTGDTLFAGSIGRTDLPGGEYDDLIVSIMDKLMGLPGDIDLFPGHGPVSDIATERTQNPFLQPFNEPDQEY